VTIKLGHEGLAESHNFAVALSVRIEVGTTLSTADRQSGKAVLEYLLEAKELDDGKVYARSKTKSALVRSNSAVELYTIAAVYMPYMIVIFPGNAELDGSLRLNHSLKESGLLILRMSIHNRAKRGKNLFYSLALYTAELASKMQITYN
jgi:hypothetical protein